MINSILSEFADKRRGVLGIIRDIQKDLAEVSAVTEALGIQKVYQASDKLAGGYHANTYPVTVNRTIYYVHPEFSSQGKLIVSTYSCYNQTTSKFDEEISVQDFKARVYAAVKKSFSPKDIETLSEFELGWESTKEELNM